MENRYQTILRRQEEIKNQSALIDRMKNNYIQDEQQRLEVVLEKSIFEIFGEVKGLNATGDVSYDNNCLITRVAFSKYIFSKNEIIKTKLSERFFTCSLVVKKNLITDKFSFKIESQNLFWDTTSIYLSDGIRAILNTCEDEFANKEFEFEAFIENIKVMKGYVDTELEPYLVSEILTSE